MKEYRTRIAEIDKEIAKLLNLKKKIIQFRYNKQVQQVIEIFLAEWLIEKGIKRIDFNRSRSHKILPYRNACIYFAMKVDKPMTLKQAGQIFGGKNHATIIHTIEEVENWKQNSNSYSNFLAIFNEVTEKLKTIEKEIDFIISENVVS